MVKSKKSKKTAVKKPPQPQSVFGSSVNVSTPKFSRDVLRTLGLHRRVFVGLVAVGWVALLVAVGATQQQQFVSLRELTQAATDVVGVSGSVMQSVILLLSLLSGSLNTALSEVQQMWQFFIYLFIWLTTVWLLRHLLAGHTHVSLRDGLYSAGAPLLSSLAIAAIGLVQLLPMALAVLGLAAAKASGLLEGILGVAIVAAVVASVGGLTLYWLTATFIAGVIVTIPGTYPLDALRTARNVVKGLRMKLLVHLLWLGFVVTIAVSLALLLALFIDVTLQTSVVSVLTFQIASVVAVVYASAYVYLLYRGMIEHE